MTDTLPTQTTTNPPAPLPSLVEALRNPGDLVARRAEFVKLAADRAQRAAAGARASLQSAETAATTRARELRKSTDALVTTTVARIRQVSAPPQVRSAVASGLARAAQTLQSLAKRVEQPAAAPAETPAPKAE